MRFSTIEFNNNRAGERHLELAWRTPLRVKADRTSGLAIGGARVCDGALRWQPC